MKKILFSPRVLQNNFGCFNLSVTFKRNFVHLVLNNSVRKTSNLLPRINLSSLNFENNDKSVRTPGNSRKYSRFSANRIMTGRDIFKLMEYDCIGFDLDNTLLRYKVTNMVKLEYEVMSKFLIEEKGYSKEHLEKPIDPDFLQKGLIIDFQKGNVLKINPEGYILKATHGTKFITNAEIVEYYGIEKKWEVTTEYTQNMLIAWNGPLSEKLRTLLDYFDMSASLIFGRIVDSIDEKAGKRVNNYNIWPNILDGLVYMYSREHFAINKGGYFQALKNNPEKYIHKTSENVLNWLKELKKSKTTYLITGSHIDFADFTASYAFGPNWSEYFDVIVCFAKKPGFFTGAKPFVQLNGREETTTLLSSDLKIGGKYSQGNYRDLSCILSKHSNKSNPKVLYIGDNLIQDVYTPSKFTKCDTIAVVEEMLAEGMQNYQQCHDDCELLKSSCWGSYFSINDEPSIWADVIRKHSKICIPSVNVLADYPLDYEFNCFTDGELLRNGYYPEQPINIVK